VYGDRDEIVFPFSPSCSHKVVVEILGEFIGTLVTDGYGAYGQFAKTVEALVHAQCWAHARRKFVEAEGSEPELCGRILDWIQTLYAHEATIRDWDDQKRQIYRAEYAKPVVDRIFVELKRAFEENILLPRSPFTQAANYTLEREASLRVFLENPAVPVDTNAIEREIRPIAIGRKNWMFSWTEVGVKHLGVLQSLVSTCRLQGIDPYTYLVDVLQRVDSHPQSQVHQLTPRIWKTIFAENPLHSMADTANNVARLSLTMRSAGHVQNTAVYVVLAINLEGEKELLGLWVGEAEGAKFWLSVLPELKNRGVQDILIAAVDGLKGFPEAIGRVPL